MQASKSRQAGKQAEQADVEFNVCMFAVGIQRPVHRSRKVNVIYDMMHPTAQARFRNGRRIVEQN